MRYDRPVIPTKLSIREADRWCVEGPVCSPAVAALPANSRSLHSEHRALCARSSPVGMTEHVKSSRSAPELPFRSSIRMPHGLNMIIELASLYATKPQSLISKPHKGNS